MRAVHPLIRVPVLACCCLPLLGACNDPDPPFSGAAAVPAFVGSAACQRCHLQQFADWRDSHHDLAMQQADATTVLGDFDDARHEYFGQPSRFYRDGERFMVRTQNSDGEQEDFEVSYVFGVDPLQQYLVEFDGGHLQPLPFAWDARPAERGGQRWYHLYPDEYIGPDDPLFWTGRAQNWNYMCAECHSTNVELNYDPEGDTFATTFSEIDVGCEACHGPASLHVAAAEDGQAPSRSGLVMAFDDRRGVTWRMNPETGIAERSRLAMQAPREPEACGRCHARRGLIAPEYEYAHPLTDTHRPALLVEPLYFSDGQIRDEVYVYGSFVQSRMYQAGVTCSDCHDPHSLALRTGDDPDAVCAQCHLPARFAVTDHHGHASGEVACVDCHMPERTYMVVDERRDHSLRIPRPHLSIDSDVPNACTMCHQDRTDDWAARAAAEWWGTPQPREPVGAGIVRGTALASLGTPLSPGAIGAVERGLRDPDPIVRMGALVTATALPPETLVQRVVPLLTDDVRVVRIDAASVLAPFSAYLSESQRGQFDRAADEFRAAQMAIASRPVAHVALAEFEGRLGNLERALGHTDHALRLDPDNALARHSRGLLLVRLQRQDEALGELEAAARLAPESARFAYVYAVALNSLGQSDEALRVLEEARANHPDDPDIASFLDMLRAD